MDGWMDGVCVYVCVWGEGEVMIDWLLEILQEVWRTKQLPSEWKKLILVPVHKKKDRKVCDNYRGISLLSIPGQCSL